MAIIKPSAKKGPVTKAVVKPGGARGGKGTGFAAGGKGAGGGSWVFVPAGGVPHVPVGKGARATVLAPWAPVLAKGGKGGMKGQQDERHVRAMDKLGKIEAERKVWVGGLPKDCGNGKLMKHFKESDCKPSQLEILSAKSGTACLAFKDAETASNAIAILNGSELDGKTIEVDVWTQKEKKERPEGEKRPKKNKVMKNMLKVKGAVGKDPMSEKMREKLKLVDHDLKAWVGGMKKTTTWKQLKEHFASNGCEVDLCHVNKPGTACVTFKTSDDVSNAIAVMNATECDGETIEVDVWTRPEKKEKVKKEKEA